jgi:cytochrome c oxidase subunit 1
MVSNSTEPAAGGDRSWLLSTDHKRIALLHLGTLAALLVVGSALALALAYGVWRPESVQNQIEIHTNLLAAHGVVMTFLVALPAIPLTLGTFVLPLMLGLPNLPFPRLARTGLWIYCAGAALALGALMTRGKVRTAWTFAEAYDPSATGTSLLWMMSGALLVAVAGLFLGLNVIVSIHRLRSQDPIRVRLPVLAWAAYAASIIAVLVPVPLALALGISVAERTIGVGIFNAKHGGDPLLFQHLFWLYAHPAIFGSMLWAIGVAGELLAVHARRPLFGYNILAPLLFSAGFLAIVSWGTHLVGAGISDRASAEYSLVALLSLVPVILLIPNWLATLWRGSIALTAPMILALSIVVNLSIWIATTLALEVLSIGSWLRGTEFDVASLHYGLVGVTLTAFLAGLLHWWPRLTGRLYEPTLARAGAVALFVGVNMTFIAGLLAGLHGDRLGFDLSPSGADTVVAVGSSLLVGSLLLLGVVLLRSLRSGTPAPSNPWEATTLEWNTATPSTELVGES